MLAFPPGYKNGKCAINVNEPYGNYTVKRAIYDTYAGPFYIDDELLTDGDEKSSPFNIRACKYCSTPLSNIKISKKTTTFIEKNLEYGFYTVYKDGRYGSFGYSGRQQLHSMNIKECPNEKCGWWILRQDIEWVPAEAAICFYHTGEFKIFDTTIPDTHIEELRKEITKNPNIVFQTHFDTFEKIVAACIRDKFPGSNVTHVGRSGDGGVDIYCVLGNEPCLVQVKHRKSKLASEGPSAVRELNGVLLREGIYHGMLVTTAYKFTDSAKYETKIKMKVDVPIKIDLIPFNGVIDLIRETASLPNTANWKPYHPWQAILVPADTDKKSSGY